MIKWGIIGLGNMARKFASSIGETNNSKLIGEIDLDPFFSPPQFRLLETSKISKMYSVTFGRNSQTW